MPANTKAIQVLNLSRSVAAVTRPADVDIYIVGDAISNVTTDAHFEYAGAMSGDGKWSGEILSVKLVSSTLTDAANAGFTIAFFSEEIDDTADHDPFAITDAQALTYLGSAVFVASDWVLGTLNMMAVVNTTIKVKTPAASSIFAQLIADTTYTPASGQFFTSEITVRQD